MCAWSRRSLGAAILALATLTANTTLAATWTVRSDGTGDYNSIQDAIDGAGTGDTILVGDGSYNEQNLHFAGKDLALRSENGPGTCSIYGSSSTHIFVFDSTESPAAVVDGFTISGGWATQGGGVYITGVSSPTIANNIISGNHADEGAGVCVSGSGLACAPRLVNNLIEDNFASSEGGGIALYYGTLFLRNNTIAYNTAPSGGGMVSSYSANLDATENIIWGNLYGTQLVGPVVGMFQYNLVAGISGIPTNFDGNPAFVSGPLGGYYLGASSDAIDAGGQNVSTACYAIGTSSLCMGDLTTSTSPAFDTGVVDVGYHHVRVPLMLDVPSAFPSIASAIGAAIDGDTIRLAAGTYSGAGNRDLVIDGRSVSLIGPSTGVATIDCGGSAGSPHRALTVTNIHSGVSLEALTFTNGYATYGGAVSLTNATVNVRRCVFSGNHAGDASGALHVATNSRATVEDSSFLMNVADNAGGAMAIGVENVVLRRCRFEENDAYWAGGALYFNNGMAQVEDCLFRANTSPHWGGAFHVQNAYSAPTFTRCTFHANSAPTGGVGYARTDATASLDHCILSGSPAGAATYCQNGGTITLSCSDVWGNVGGDYTACISGMAGTDGNVSLDPLYCDVGDGEFALLSTSPCADGVSTCGRMGWSATTCTSTDAPEIPLADSRMPILRQNHPNPFNPSTVLEYELPSGFEGPVQLSIYDLGGHLVVRLVDGSRIGGLYRAIWHGTDDGGNAVASGVYVARLESGNQFAQRKMVLLR